MQYLAFATKKLSIFNVKKAVTLYLPNSGEICSSLFLLASEKCPKNGKLTYLT